MVRILRLLTAMAFLFVSYVSIGQTITTFLWDDLNGDGIQNGGEPGLAGQVGNIQLWDFTTNMNTGLVATDLLGGTYQFSGMAPGTYYMVYTTPAGYVVTNFNADGFDTELTDGGTDSDLNPATGATYNITVTGVTAHTTADAGFFLPASIGDFVWEDINANGLFDGTEAGLPANTVSISLTDPGGAPVNDANGNPVASPILNGAGGTYTFANLAPGDYRLTFTPSNPLYYRSLFNQDGNDTEAGDTNNDSDADRMTGQSRVFTLISNEMQTNIDGGFVQGATISDFVWEDLNGNGLQDGGEPGLGGVTVSITDDLGAGVNDLDGFPVGPTVTTGAGAYSFMNLDPTIDYILTFVSPAAPTYYLTTQNAAGGATDATDADNDSDADQMNGMTHIIMLDSDETEIGIDAGFYRETSVGDLVWCDADGNGLFDGAELGAPGISITLLDDMGVAVATDIMGNPLVNPMISDAAGMYLFDNLPPGTYQIRAVLAAPYDEFTMQDQAGVPGMDVGDVNNDSDVNPANGFSHQFSMNSGDPTKDIVDVGVWYYKSVGGSTWGENVDNGIFDGAPTDNVIGGILINIYIDNDMDGIPDPPGGPFMTTVSDGLGNYNFNNLPPNHYIVEVDRANFNTGGILELYTVSMCTGPNPSLEDNTNDGCIIQPDGAVRTATFQIMSCDMGFPGDNTGMETWVDFGFFLEFDCSNPPIVPEQICDDLETNPDYPLCDLNLLAAYCGTMLPNNAGGNQPSPLCPGGGAPHNISWFSFVAPVGNYDIVATPSACSNPNNPNLLGIQIGLYDDCTFSNAVFCNPNCVTTPAVVPSTSLIPGETYYFFFDGCGGSICDIEIDINGNYSPYSPPPPTQLLCDAAPMCDEICPGTQVTFELGDLDLGDLDYIWDLPSGSGWQVVNPQNPQNQTDVNNITLQFDEVGSYTVCFNSAIGKCFSTPGGLCQTVNVIEIPDEMFMPIEVCEDDFPYSIVTNEDPNGDGVIGWQGPAAPGPDPMFTHTVMTAAGCEYDQVIEIIQLDIPPTEVVDTAACDMGFNYHGLNIMQSVEDVFYTLPFPSSNGCDSNVILNAYVIVHQGSIQPGPCLANGIQLELVTTIIAPLNFDNFTITWYDEANMEIGTGEFVTVPASGTYTAVVEVEKAGLICSDTYDYVIDFADYLPVAPTANNWDQNLCSGVGLVTYNATSTEFGILGFNWTWPADVNPAFVSGQGTDNLTIDWTGSMGGDVCVSVITNCGEGPQTCLPITIEEVPTPSFTNTTLNCIDSIFIIEYDGPAVMNADYIWDFDGGIPNGNGMGPGPHEVVYATAGMYDVTLMLEVNTCQSSMVSNMLESVVPSPPPLISCVPGLGSVTFSWNDVPDATNYSVDVTSGQTGMMNGNTYTVDGLAEGESVTIALTTETSSPCGDIVITSAPCISQNCTPPTVTVNTPQQDICLDANTMPFDLTATIDPVSNGTGTYMGTGITDPVAGTFDPAQATIGANTINYTYEDEDGCFGSGQVTINIFETPVADFSVDVSTLCILDEAMVEYTGAILGGNYTWDFGVDAMTSGSGPGPFMVTWNSPGEKIISLTVDKDGCTSTEQTLMVTVEDQLMAPAISCFEQNTTFVTFEWDPVANATDYEVIIDGVSQGNQAGTTYTEDMLLTGTTVTIQVIANSANSCPSSTSAETDCVAENCPATSLEFPNDVTDLCIDATTADILLDYTVIGGFMDGSGIGTWSGTGVTQVGNDYFFSPTTAGEGSFTAYLDYIEDVCPTSDSIQFNLTETPVADFSVLPAICVTDILDLNYTGTIDPLATITWTIEGTTVIDDGNNNYSAQWAAPGDYLIELLVEKGNCSSGVVSAMVTVEPEIEAPVLNCAPSLNDVTVSWNDVDCVSGYEVFVDDVSEGIVTDTEFVVGGLVENESFDIYVVAVSNCLCTDAISVEITCTAMACPSITVDLVPDVTSLCSSEISGNIAINAMLSGDDGSGTADWTGPGVDNNGMFDPSVAGIGLHMISYVYTQSGCTYPGSTEIEIFENPDFIIMENNPECYSDDVGSIEVTPSGGDGNYSILLDGNAVTGPTLTDVSAGNHTIEVIDGNGCNVTKQASIVIPDEPVPVVSGPSLLLAGEEGTYNLDLSDFGGLAVDSIIWFNGLGDVLCTGDCPTVSSSTVDPIQICAQVFYGNCVVEDCIEVRSETIDVLTFPNVFSPNGDGANEVFFLSTNQSSIIITALRVYDRWGELVFLNQNFLPNDPSQGWDGTFKGNLLNPGVYVYVMEYTDETLEPQVEVGDITLIR